MQLYCFLTVSKKTSNAGLHYHRGWVHSIITDGPTNRQSEKKSWENLSRFPWHNLCLTSHNSSIFYRIYKKLVTVTKILKKSLKWDQSGISSFIRSKVMSKTSRIMTKNQWPRRKAIFLITYPMFECLYLRHFSTDLQKIGDGLKDLEKIFQMGPIWHF